MLGEPENQFSLTRAALSLKFKEYVEGLGHHAIVKTTKRKGLDILTFIEVRLDFQMVFDGARAAAERFVNTQRFGDDAANQEGKPEKYLERPLLFNPTALNLHHQDPLLLH